MLLQASGRGNALYVDYLRYDSNLTTPAVAIRSSQAAGQGLCRLPSNREHPLAAGRDPVLRMSIQVG